MKRVLWFGLLLTLLAAGPFLLGAGGGSDGSSTPPINVYYVRQAGAVLDDDPVWQALTLTDRLQVVDELDQAQAIIAYNARPAQPEINAVRQRGLGHNANAKLLPNALDETLWDVSADIETRFKQAEQAVRILYMGTMTHGDDLAMLEYPITRLKEEYGDRITFEIIGVVPGVHDAWYTALIVPPGVEGDYREFVKWLGSQSRWDIGVAPLIDNESNSCKSNIKYLDYTALGLASVCSDVTPYNEAIDNGLTGILVENNSEAWYQAIKRLMDDALYRRELVARAHKDLYTQYTLDAQSEMRKGIWKEISSTKSIRMIHADKVEASNRNRKRMRDEVARILENIGAAERSIRDDGVGGKLTAAYYYMNKRRIFYRLFSMVPPRLRQRVKTILIGDHCSGGSQ